MQDRYSGNFAPTATGSALFLSSFWRTSLILAVLNFFAAGVTLLAVNMVSELAWAQRANMFADGSITDGGILSLVLQVGLPAGIVLAFVSAAGDLAVAAVLGGQLQKKLGRGSTNLRFFASLWRGLQRALVFAGAFALVTVEIGVALALSPMISLAGIVLLLVFGIRKALGKPSTNRWLTWPMLVAYAIPLGLAAVILVHSLLILPIAAFERHGVVGLMRRSSELVSGRVLRVSIAAFCGVIGYAAVIALIAAIGFIDGAQAVSSALLLIAQFTAAAFPVAMLVAAYFDATGGRVPPEHALRSVGFQRSPGFGVVATGAAVALLLGFIVPADTQPAWAQVQPVGEGEFVAPAQTGETQDSGIVRSALEVEAGAEGTANTEGTAGSEGEGASGGSESGSNGNICRK